MASRENDQSDKETAKVGSDANAAKSFAGRSDFGARADDKVEREYVSSETKQNDPGAGRSRMRSSDSTRDSGAGANASGPGSGSGGDIDSDFVGLDGSGLSQAGPDERTEGADMTTTGGSDAFAAAGPKGHKNFEPRQKGIQGTTVNRSGGDVSTTGAAGSGAVTNPSFSNGDDAEAGEISAGEADGSIERE